jgi:hypothetical protein
MLPTRLPSIKALVFTTLGSVQNRCMFWAYFGTVWGLLNLNLLTAHSWPLDFGLQNGRGDLGLLPLVFSFEPSPFPAFPPFHYHFVSLANILQWCHRVLYTPVLLTIRQYSYSPHLNQGWMSGVWTLFFWPGHSYRMRISAVSTLLNMGPLSLEKHGAGWPAIRTLEIHPPANGH